MTAQKNINSADTKSWPVTAARETAAKFFDKKEKEQNEEIFRRKRAKIQQLQIVLKLPPKMKRAPPKEKR